MLIGIILYKLMKKSVKYGNIFFMHHKTATFFFRIFNANRA